MTLTIDTEPLYDGAELATCDSCGRDTPADEGDLIAALDTEFSLCESCVEAWGLHGIPNHIAAIYGG